MTDGALREWWPDLGALVAGLRRVGQSAVADRLALAVEAGATSSEILGGVGLVLREHRAVRRRLDAPSVAAWDAVMSDVRRAFPGQGLSYLFTRLRGKLRRQPPRPPGQANTD